MKTFTELKDSMSETEALKALYKLFDENSFTETQQFTSAEGERSGVITGFGLIDGAVVYAFAQDKSIKSGAVTKSTAGKLKKLYEMAAKNGSPIVGIYDSNGGDIKEGAALLAAYSEIMKMSAELSGVVPQFSIISGVCGGITATLASMADFVIMTEKSEFFLTPPFIAKDGKLEGAGSANNAAISGVATFVEKDLDEAIKKAGKLIRILPQNNLELSGNDEFEENDAVISAEKKGIEYLESVADKNSLVELSKEFGNTAITALGSVNWRTVGFVATNKTDGLLNQNDCSKIARFVNICDSFSIPVVTVIDTEGFEKSVAAELAGAVRDSAKLAQVYMSATTPKISIITGNAIGGVISAFGAFSSANDLCLAYENAVISPAPIGAAALMINNAELDKKPLDEIANEYKNTSASVYNATAAGVIDRIILPEETRTAITGAIDITSGKRTNQVPRKHINLVF